ncbi:U-box domain-containing protein 9 [Dichanthelium oligosanthes]|uniref:RING-type E3 ubiquitin transferase n=1 Tax=Dichanthelium oligosanthes TaxID=888268 RepID=A0A1E5UTM9_9POAL|nr:U-box domain-containing protein 9 [Dichanthelium oligosanthes]
MAKPTPVASAEEAAALRRRLRRLVAAVAAGSADAEAFDEAADALAKLRDAELAPRKDRVAGAGGGANKGGTEAAAVPEQFLCPISSEIMRDPVVLASGQTYDRRFIQEWLTAGNRTCPQTQQVLSNTILIPNHLVRSMISQWYTDNGITLPPVENQEEDLVTNNERKTFSKIFERIASSSNLSEQREAIKDLRLLTKCNSSLRAAIGEKPDSISQMISTVSNPELENNAEVLEDMVTTILNLSIHESNKKIIGDDPLATPFLIRALQSGTMEARSNAAAAIFSLSALDSNKVKIGELGAMRPLVDLLEHGSMIAKKDAASAIFNLCMLHENKSRATKSGVIDVTLKAIADDSLVDESLAILALLSGDHETVEEIGETGGVASMLHVIKEDQCKRNKENAAAVLFAVCIYDRTKLREVAEDENLNGSLAWLVQDGTSRARRKAAGILEKMKRAVHHTHYSC